MTQQLKSMNWKGRDACRLCSDGEDVDHLLFTYQLVVFVWPFVGEALGWNGYPRSMEELKTI
jgi:hypothetical protein